MAEWTERTEMLLGSRALARLQSATVYVFGLGAVGSYAVEGLARAGIGHMRLVDFDRFKESNRNRQLYATVATMGRLKVEVAAERLRDINPSLVVEPMAEFAHTESVPRLLDGRPDVVIDAIDSVNPKVALIAAAVERGLPVLSSMGAATRLDADAIRFGPLFEARGCPLARVIRKRLRRQGVTGDLWCVYSEEAPILSAVRDPDPTDQDYQRGRQRRTLGSLSTLTGLFGLRLAHEAILRLVEMDPRHGSDSPQ